jgi:hypothetical protein
MQFCKVYNIYDCIKNLAWAWGVTKECMTGIWKKTLKRFVHDFKGFAKDENNNAKISKAVVEMASNFNLGVDEDVQESPPQRARRKAPQRETQAALGRWSGGGCGKAGM